MADFADELEPLFDYSRVQPRNIVCVDDDDDDDDDDVYAKKKRKISQPVVEKGKTQVKVVQVVDCEEDEDDWLPPPPKVSSDAQTTIGENSTLRELRLKKQELVSFTLSAQNLLKSVESAKSENCNSLEPSSVGVSGETVKPPLERDKILISFQNKDGLKNIRVYRDDNFERIFKMYADNLKLDLKRLAFSFDGDKISPSETPGSLGMEDEDIIEVHVKST